MTNSASQFEQFTDARASAFARSAADSSVSASFRKAVKAKGFKDLSMVSAVRLDA